MFAKQNAMQLYSLVLTFVMDISYNILKDFGFF
jgi:hypothetical protein